MGAGLTLGLTARARVCSTLGKKAFRVLLHLQIKSRLCLPLCSVFSAWLGAEQYETVKSLSPLEASLTS